MQPGRDGEGGDGGGGDDPSTADTRPRGGGDEDEDEAGPDASGEFRLPVPQRAAPLPERAEIVIVGAGVVGLAIAYYLAKHGVTDVVVVDRGYLAEGASGRNGGGVRQQWSTELNIRLMQQSVELCRRFAVELGVNVWFRQGGYLFLARTPKEVARLEKNAALQNKCGVPTRMLEPAAAGEIVPELELSGVVAAAYNPTDGILFPWPFLWGYARQAAALGVKILTHTGVTALAPASPGWFVHTERGAVRARRVINATGAWSTQIGRMAGIEVPTWPIRHEICSSEPLKPFLRPMVSELSSGLYCSQSMRGEIVGGVTVPGHGPTYAMGSTLEFLATYARRLVRLMPILGDIKILRQWAGPYDQSPDGNPILGEAPGAPDFFLACGFVGHGFMMAPIVGKLYGDWLAKGERHEIFERFTLGRFAAGATNTGDKEDFNIG
jgi:sarcosine oxidase subunit beta